MDDDRVITARRTSVRSGKADLYARVHARIPEAVATALRECGVLRWQIFADGDALFHVIETRRGYQAMLERIVAMGPIDPEWDARIAELLDPDAASDRLLPQVWAIDDTAQHGAAEPR